MRAENPDAVFPHMGGKPQKHCAKTTAKTCWPEDSRDAEKIVFNIFIFVPTQSGRKTRTKNHTSDTRKPDIIAPFFSLTGILWHSVLEKKRMVDWNSLSLLRKHESTLHSYDPHFPTSRPRVRQKSPSLKHVYPHILSPIERQLLLLPYFTKKKGWIHSVAVCIRGSDIKTCYFESPKIAKS